MFRKIFKLFVGFLDFVKSYFFILLFLFLVVAYFANLKEQKQVKPNLMRIDITGPIMQSDDFLKKIDEAKENNIKGVLLYINSPGGLIAPSVEMSLAVKRLQRLKPVVVYASGAMASGSYYAGIWADKIVANPGSIIGSIGVIFEGFDISKLLQKAGVKEQIAKMGKYKEAGTFLREWNDDEKAEINRVLKNNYEMFVKDVASARGLKIKDKDKFADAHIFTPFEAKKVGLIDEVGSIYEAKKILVNKSGVSTPRWKKRDKMEKIIDKFLDKTSAKVSSLIFGYRIF